MIALRIALGRTSSALILTIRHYRKSGNFYTGITNKIFIHDSYRMYFIKGRKVFHTQAAVHSAAGRLYGLVFPKAVAMVRMEE